MNVLGLRKHQVEGSNVKRMLTNCLSNQNYPFHSLAFNKKQIGLWGYISFHCTDEIIQKLY